MGKGDQFMNKRFSVSLGGQAFGKGYEKINWGKKPRQIKRMSRRKG